ncbi:MAG: MFS transporter [Mycobacterium sp.]
MTDRPWKLALGLQASLVSASWTGVRLMIGYRALALGADPFFLGLLASSMALPALLAALPAGRVTDRIGGSIVATAGMVIAAAGSVCGFLLPGLWILLAVAACIGFGQILIMVGQQTFVANVSADSDSDAAFGTLTASASIGQLIGPPLVTTAASLAAFGGQSHPNTTVGLMVCAALILLAAPTYVMIRPVDRSLTPARDTKDEDPAQVSQLLKTPQMWRSLAVSGAVLVTVDLMYAFVPVWATDRGISATVVGLLLALRAAVSVLSRFGLTRLVARFGRKVLIVVSIGASVAALIALPFVNAWGAAAVMIGLGLGLGIPQPLTMAWVTSLTPSPSHGATLGMRLTSNRLAQITLPLAVGAFAAPLGVLGIFWANAALLLGAIAIMARSKAGEPDPP